ncbi:hypothetical protein [Nocardia sp. CA-145437]|uniref:hypothetical protein n=1 Tax=Nocardia sp. CA-145437 TaxID=3239980 RepID=UPI003D9923C1
MTTSNGSRAATKTAEPQAIDLRLCFSVDLTDQHTNRAVLVDGPDVIIRAVGARPVAGGDAR